jgi:hypothetical protein
MLHPSHACSPVSCTTSVAGTEQLRSCDLAARIVAESQVDDQLRRLREVLTAEAHSARRWRYTWTAINGLSTVAPLAILPFVSRANWVDLVVGSAASALSTGVTMGWPLRVEQVEATFDAMSSLPPCERVRALEVFAVSASYDETARRAWPWHALNLGVSAALGTVLAFNFHRRTAGLVTGLSGFLAGEAQLFTQPSNLGAEPQAHSGWPFMLPMWRGVADDGGYVGILAVWPLR